MIGHLLLLALHRQKNPFEKRLGFVADFCPICRDARSFRLMEFGVGKEVKGHWMECEDCRARLATSLATRNSSYIYVAKERQPDLELLIQTTNPSLRHARDGRLKFESELKKGKARLSPDARRQLLMEPLTALTFMVESRFAKSTQMDAASSLGCGATTAIVAGLFFYSSFRLRGPAQDQALLIMAIAAGLGLIYNLFQIHRAPNRFVRKRVVPLVGRALRPLRPGRKDIEDSLAQCRQSNLRIGRLVKPDWLLSSIQKLN